MKTPIFDMTHHRLQFICTVDSRFKGLGFLLLATEVVEWSTLFATPNRESTVMPIYDADWVGLTQSYVKIRL